MVELGLRDIFFDRIPFHPLRRRGGVSSPLGGGASCI
jgi:hypothetical protein